MSRLVVLGLGNLLLTDDGVGVRAVQQLRDDPRIPEGVTLVDGGTLGLELLSCAADADHLLVLDAVDAGLEPGSLVRLDASVLDGLPGGVGVHQLGVVDLIAAMHLLGRQPREVLVFGIQPLRVCPGAELTPTVESALGPLSDAAVGQLRLWIRQEHNEADAGCTR